MNNKIQKVKTKLLDLGYIDNEWLVKYLEILEANLDTPRNRISTQSHHAIPVNSYWISDEPYDRKEAIKLARLDSDNFNVNLTYKDHLKIHSYLTLCTDLEAVQRRYEAQSELRKRNSKIAVAAGNSAVKIKQTKDKTIIKTKATKNLSLYYSAEEADEILNL